MPPVARYEPASLRRLSAHGSSGCATVAGRAAMPTLWAHQRLPQGCLFECADLAGDVRHSLGKDCVQLLAQIPWTESHNPSGNFCR